MSHSDVPISAERSQAAELKRLRKWFAVGRLLLLAFNVWVFVLLGVALLLGSQRMPAVPDAVQSAAFAIFFKVHISIIFTNFALAIFLFRVIAKHLSESHALLRIGTVCLIFVPLYGLKRYQQLWREVLNTNHKNSDGYTPAKAYQLTVKPLAFLLTLSGLATIVSCFVAQEDALFVPLISDPTGKRLLLISVGVFYVGLGAAFLQRRAFAIPLFWGFLILGTMYQVAAGLLDNRFPLEFGIAAIPFNLLVAWGVQRATKPALEADWQGLSKPGINDSVKSPD